MWFRALTSRQFRWVGWGLLVCAAAGIGWRYSLTPESSSELLAKARQALERREFDSAAQLAVRIPADDPLWAESLLVVGEAASRQGDYKSAEAAYSRVPNDGSDAAVLALQSRAELYYYTGRISQAVECYEELLREQPASLLAHSRLGTLLGVTGQRWAVRPHYLALIRGRGWTVKELALLGDLERPVEPEGYLDRCLANAPDDVLVQLAVAAADVVAGRSKAARSRLTKIVRVRPGLIPAQAMLGALLLREASAFQAWHAGLPPGADDNADIWYVRGMWYRDQTQLEPAARCLWEAVRRAPDCRRATYQLSQVLSALGRPEAGDFAMRASQMHELTHHLDEVLSTNGRDESTMRQVTELLHGMGRDWEAWAWATTGSQTFPNAEWPRAVIADVSPKLSANRPLVSDDANLSLRYDLSRLPYPVDELSPSDAATPGAAPAAAGSQIRFVDRAAASQLDFTYHNGDAHLEHHGARMFEQTGGGAAVLDYDLDLWPDLVFPQGTPWPLGSSQPTPDPSMTDRLFRNRRGREFGDVTAASRLGDGGFGQGAAVGDFNSDGFPDLYVANIGRNRLYENNGDGTWSDVSDAAGLQHTDWTTSCLVCDLNADGHPDLFDVNYVDGPRVFELLCEGYGCSPKNFEGIPDRLLISRGDGAFEDIPNATPQVDSKGLGIVAVEFEERRRPCLLIANDQVPNFLLRNHSLDAWPGVRFENDGFVSGLAYNVDGLAMASMGIAAGDADGDGSTDFFISNFRDESSTLYLQDAPGLFVESARTAGLTEPSLPYVGWGTQFLDAELDGLPDIVVVNGHVDDYRSKGQGYHMPAQFFHNLGKNRFAEMKSEAGPFFEELHLGRGLARLDWNGDGRMDFAVSNMNEPASLVTNQTTPTGRFVNVTLRATRTARDAIGANVTVRTAAGEARQQLVAGDGYMASNQRMLQFGVGEAESVREIVVEWPSGRTTVLRDVPTDVTIALVEDCRTGTLWRGDAGESLEIP